MHTVGAGGVRRPTGSKIGSCSRRFSFFIGIVFDELLSAKVVAGKAISIDAHRIKIDKNLFIEIRVEIRVFVDFGCKITVPW